ncbi:hypothetical protein N0V90_005845 [Kalmusia sp. IMI 367209]|nr:hypothetical protein N0V90_005845 [Kalmusia sp. IMI 367209]
METQDTESNSVKATMQACTTPPPHPLVKANENIRISISTTVDSPRESPRKAMVRFLLNKHKKSSVPTSSGKTTPEKDKHKIDPTDGKTKGCDRTRTFESFIDSGKLGEAGETEAISHMVDVMKRLKKIFGKGRAKGKGIVNGVRGKATNKGEL